MTLLFDQNLSPRLVKDLADIFPGACHVSNVGLDHAPDEIIWTFARDNSLIVVSKDSHFSDLAVVRGFPPKVVWLRLGNCTTREVTAALRTHSKTIELFKQDSNAGVLTIF